MMLEKLTFKFEGDYEKGHQLQQGITRTFGELTKLQHQASGAEYPQEKPANALLVAPRTVRRRRRRAVGADGGEIDDNGEQNGDSSARKTSGVSTKQLLLDLKTQGFFAEPRTNNQVVAELNKKGHTHIRDNHLTSPLKRLCTAEILKREQNAQGVWTYLNGPKDAE